MEVTTNNRTKLFGQLIASQIRSYDFDQLIENIRIKKDDYSLIENGSIGVVDINAPTNEPFRWSESDIGKELVILDAVGLFGSQRAVELTLTSLSENVVEFVIDRVTLLDIDQTNGRIEIEDQEEFEYGGLIQLKRGHIILLERFTDLLNRIRRFPYNFGTPEV